MDPIIRAYNDQALALVDMYEQVSPESVHAAMLPSLPGGKDLLALDVGAGSGRDAA